MVKKSIRYAINAISVVLIVLSVVILLSSVLRDPQAKPSICGYSLFRVLTGSMEPSIGQGDLLLVKQVPVESLQVGDVISFFSADPQLQGAINTHRIARRQGDEFITRGDANKVDDAYAVPPEDVVGKVIWQSAGLGRIAGFLSKPAVFLGLIMLPIAVILIMNLRNAVRLTKQAMLAEETEKLCNEPAVHGDGATDAPDAGNTAACAPTQEENHDT